MQITMRTSAPGASATSVVSMAPSLQLPESSGSVVVDSADPTALPRIELRFLASDVDNARLIDGVEVCLALAEHEQLARSLGERMAPTPAASTSRKALSAWLRSAVRTSHHCCGTCAMGPATDPSAVVDQSGRVWGLPNLRVVDASVFPICVRANPNATVLMLAERVAAAIAGGPELSRGEPARP
jgi:choline dehydrogenase